MPDISAKDLTTSQLYYSSSISRKSLETGKKDITNQTITELYRINQLTTEISGLKNDTENLEGLRREANLDANLVEGFIGQANKMIDIASQLAVANSPELEKSLTDNFKTTLNNFDAQVKGSGFDGSQKGSVSINGVGGNSTGSNEYSLSTTNHIVGGGIYAVAGTKVIAKQFTIDAAAGVGTGNAVIEVTIGGQKITETYTQRVGDTLNEGNNFGASADTNVRARNLAESISKSSSSKLRDMFDISVANNVITFKPKTTLSNFQVTLNGGNVGVAVADIGGTTLNPIEMRLLNKTSNKEMGKFENTGFGLIGTTNAAGDITTSTTTILTNAQIDGTGAGSDIGVLGSVVAGDTNANKAIYNRLAGMSQTELSTIIKDLQALWTNSAAGLGTAWGGAAGNSNINTLRTKLDTLATGNFINNTTRNFLKDNFFAINNGNGSIAALVANQTGAYSAANGGNINGGSDSVFGNNVHNANVAQTLIADINKLVTTAYYKKMLAADTKFISTAARTEIANGVAVGGGVLDARAGGLIYTFTTRYNGKDYVGITGKNTAGGDLNDAGSAVYFFEKDSASGLPKAGADIAFKVNFAAGTNIAAVVIGANNGLDALLNNQVARFQMGMTESNYAAHISINGANLNSYSSVTKASMTRSGDNAVMKIEIDGAEFIATKSITDINALGFGGKITFEKTGSTDTVTLTINDQNKSSRSLFRDSSGNALSGDTFEEISNNFLSFFHGKSVKVSTLNGIEIEVEKNDLRASAIMDYSILSDVTKDNVSKIIDQLKIGSRKLTGELARYTTATELATAVIGSIGNELEIKEENLDQIRDADPAIESDNLKKSMRAIKTINTLTNLVDTVRNNIDSASLRNLEDYIRNI